MRPTAVAAPPAEPFEDLFEFIDQMPVRDLPRLAAKLRRRHNISMRVLVTSKVTINDVVKVVERWHQIGGTA